MPIVPIRSGGQSPAPQPQAPPDVYLMMAAAQMHKEGRLVKPSTEPDIPSTVRGAPQLPQPEPPPEPRKYPGPGGKSMMMAESTQEPFQAKSAHDWDMWPELLEDHDAILFDPKNYPSKAEFEKLWDKLGVHDKSQEPTVPFDLLKDYFLDRHYESLKKRGFDVDPAPGGGILLHKTPSSGKGIPVS